MAISSVTVSNSYVSTGTVGPYPYTFKIIVESDLLVTSKNAGGAVTTYVYPTDYSVSGAGNAAGGSVTFSLAIPTGDTVLITRNVPATQQTSFRTLGTFLPEVHEDALDRATML